MKRRQIQFESDSDRNKVVSNYVEKQVVAMILAIAFIPVIIFLMSLIAAHGQKYNW
jgi:hypothetical protein